MSFEKNTKQSFARVKADMEHLQRVANQLNENQKVLIQWVTEMKGSTKSRAKRLVASKESNKVHADNCPFAKNISATSRQSFNGIEEATSYGYNPCACVA